MRQYQLGEMEQRFADLIWNAEPVGSGELVRLCSEQFGWKKSTTYTMLKRLCEREIFRNADGAVTSQISKEEFHAAQGEAFLEERFGGSLPRFLAAFSSRNRLNEREISELQQLIDRQREGE